MQTARNLVAAITKFTTGMQDGQDSFNSALLSLGVDVSRNTASVVNNIDATVSQHFYRYRRSMPSQSFINAIINNFPNQVMQPFGTGAANVHTRPLADWLQTL